MGCTSATVLLAGLLPLSSLRAGRALVVGSVFGTAVFTSVVFGAGAFALTSSPLALLKAVVVVLAATSVGAFVAAASDLPADCCFEAPATGFGCVVALFCSGFIGAAAAPAVAVAVLVPELPTDGAVTVAVVADFFGALASGVAVAAGAAATCDSPRLSFP